jgi:tripartite ATP-independent transporter DctM subunit
MALGMPIAYALLVSGVALMVHLDMFDAQILAQNLINGADSFPLLAVPFFMLAGEIMNVGGLSRRIVNLALTLVGHVRGGLGYVTILAAVHDGRAVGLGRGRHRGAGRPAAADDGARRPRQGRAGGLIASAGIIAPVIPPSIGFVIFGVAANVSIGKLFMAGIVPGLLLGLAHRPHLVVGGASNENVTRRPRPAAADVAALRRVHLGAVPAGDRAGGPEDGRVHAHRGGGGGRGLRAVRGHGHLPRTVVVAAGAGVRARPRPPR